MTDFDDAVKREPPNMHDQMSVTYRVDRKSYFELRESVEKLIPHLQEQIRRQESVGGMLVANIEITIETLTRGDEIPVMDETAEKCLRETIEALEVEYANEWQGADGHPRAIELRAIIERAQNSIPDHSKPPDPNPMQSVIDRLQTVLDAAERGEIV